MEKQTIQFATVKQGNVIQKVGKSSIYQPKIEFKGGQTNWFDDSTIIKKGSKKLG